MAGRRTSAARERAGGGALYPIVNAAGTELHPVVAMSLATIPGCVAFGLIDGRDRRVLASWSRPRIDLERAVALFEDLLGNSMIYAAELIAPSAGAPPRQLVVIAGDKIHLFDRLDDGLCLVAVCRATANLASMLAAFRISRGLLSEGA